MQLSIIIVNWNSVDYLEKCMESLQRAAMPSSFEVIVVDNASAESCEARLSARFPSVRLIQSQENLGFARANNLGARHARGAFLLFLNPDTEVLGEAIELMASAAQRIPDAGALGCRLQNSDGTLQESCVQAYPCLANQIFGFDFLKRLTPRAVLWGIGALAENGTSPVQVDAISGACLMVNAKAFGDVGGFSEDYFMYSEDVDLCLKLARSGLKNYYVPNAEVRHHGGGSSARAGASAFSNVMFLESRAKYFRKHHGVVYSLLFRVAMFASSILRIAVLTVGWLAGFLFRDQSSANRRLSKWYRRLRWALGMEEWAKCFPNGCRRK